MELELGTPIEIYILLAKQLNGHVIDGVDLIFQHDGTEQRVDTGISLQKGVLGNEKRDAALSETFCILAYHVVAHNLYVATVGTQQKAQISLF